MRTIDVTCPTCGAEPGHRCHTKSGRETTTFHSTRTSESFRVGRENARSEAEARMFGTAAHAP